MDLSLAQSQVRRLSPVYWLLLQELPPALPTRRPLLRALPLLWPLLLLPELLRPLSAVGPTMGPGATGSSPPRKSGVSVVSLESLSRTSLATMLNYLLTNLSATERLFPLSQHIQSCTGMHWAHLAVHYGDIFLQ